MTYNFHIDEKVTIWQRHEYSVEAESYEQALEKMHEELAELEMPEETYKESMDLYETVSPITVEENRGHATRELYYKDEMIKSNV